jgi:hypothetical protein
MHLNDDLFFAARNPRGIQPYRCSSVFMGGKIAFGIRVHLWLINP